MPQDLNARATPARLPASVRLRLQVGTLLGDAAAVVSRALGMGSGASIRGQILTRVHPDAFADLVAGRRDVAPFLGGRSERTLTAGFPTTTATSLASLGTE